MSKFLTEKLAAFIITYERPQILKSTIKTIFEQTKSPDRLLIVDNSLSYDTQNLYNDHFKNDSRINYYRMGYNSGPSGGAYYGLKILSDQGYPYIQWYDDDNAPLFKDITETLLKLFESNEKVGVVGQAGARFSKITGNLIRFKDAQLQGDFTLEVDYVGGNQLMIIKSEVIRSGCLPEKDLFFGFEDLSFCLKVKAKGYRILVSKNLVMKLRTYTNRVGQIKLGGEASWRDYYSVRSLVYICLYERRNVLPLLFLFLKALGGLLYRKNFKTLPLIGFFHGLIGKKGIIVLPQAKTVVPNK